MQIIHSDDLLGALHSFSVESAFFNEFLNFLGGCSEYFSTTSDETDSDEEKAMYRQHAITLRSMQSKILTGATVSPDGSVRFTLPDGMLSALFYNLVSMMAPEDVPEEVFPLQEAPLVSKMPGVYCCYPLETAQFRQVTGALELVRRGLEMMGLEEEPARLLHLMEDIATQSYCFQDGDTEREMAALVVPEFEVMELFRALLIATSVEYGKTDFAATLPRE